jgi:hypothetical protein
MVYTEGNGSWRPSICDRCYRKFSHGIHIPLISSSNWGVGDFWERLVGDRKWCLLFFGTMVLYPISEDGGFGGSFFRFGNEGSDCGILFYVGGA